MAKRKAKQLLQKADRKPPENLEVQASVKSGSRTGRQIVGFKKVAHTISPVVARELREVAHDAYASESGVIELALERLFEHGRDAAVKAVNAAGIAERRKRG